MERREIEIFLTLADELHFGHTAERLFVSTARVSQTIKKLERQVGALLFERTSRQVTLTPVGRRLRDDLKPAFEQIEAGIERAVAAGRNVSGVLRVGFFRAAAGRFVLEVAGAFEARYPGCEVQIRENQLNDGLALLRDDQIDILFLMLPVEEADLVTGPVIVREARLLAVSSRHPFARRDTVSLNDLARDKILRAPSALPDYLQAAVVPERTERAADRAWADVRDDPRDAVAGRRGQGDVSSTGPHESVLRAARRDLRSDHRRCSLRVGVHLATDGCNAAHSRLRSGRTRPRPQRARR